MIRENSKLIGILSDQLCEMPFELPSSEGAVQPTLEMYRRVGSMSWSSVALTDTLVVGAHSQAYMEQQASKLVTEKHLCHILKYSTL